MRSSDRRFGRFSLGHHHQVDEWPEWQAFDIIDRGLPRVPGPVLPAFNEVPVAVWRRGILGAVLFIYFDPDDLAEPYSQDIEVLQQGDCRSWVTLSRGGSDWPVPFGHRPSTDVPLLTGFSMGSDEGWIASGIAPHGLARVQAARYDRLG